MSRKGNHRTKNHRSLYVAMATKCHYCKHDFKEGTLRAEHVIPLCRGGTDQPSNIVAACGQCDSWKGPLTGDEFVAVRSDHAARKSLITAVFAAMQEGKSP